MLLDASSGMSILSFKSSVCGGSKFEGISQLFVCVMVSDGIEL